MRIYISGAISSDINYQEKFEKAAMELKAAGHTPISPTDLPGGLTEGEYMQLDHLLISFADAVLMLPDWLESMGSKIEYELAIHAGKPVFFAANDTSRQALGLPDMTPVRAAT